MSGKPIFTGKVSDMLIVDEKIKEKKSIFESVLKKLINDPKNPLHNSTIKDMTHDSNGIICLIKPGLGSIDFSDLLLAITQINSKIRVSLVVDTNSNGYIVKATIPNHCSLFGSFPKKRFLFEVLIFVLLLGLFTTFCYLLFDHWRDYHEPWIGFLKEMEAKTKSLFSSNSN
jgi:hypothetical protein